MTARSEEDKQLFQKLKELCVPLLGNAILTPSSLPEVSTLLSNVLTILHDAKKNGRILKPALISYVFFPVSSILRRNSGSAIPDQIIEKLLSILTILCDDWWWDMDVKIWEQIFMLCGAVIGGIENKGKGKDRADETKETAAQCLWTLLRKRYPYEDPLGIKESSIRSITVFSTLQAHSRTTQFVPIIGQTVDSLLSTCQSRHLPLVRMSIKVLEVIISDYIADDVVTSIFPGVVSGMCKVALAIGSAKALANGDIVAAALRLLQQVIVRCIGDEICTKAGVIVAVDSLEDLVELETQTADPPEPAYIAPYTTRRTKSWLRGSSSQLHMALISLKPLVTHPTPSALLALSSFSAAILEATLLTLPQSQPLLLSWLLSLTHSEYANVSSHAKKSLHDLLNPTSAHRHAFTQILLQISKEHLTTLPRLLPSHSDTKVEHSAKIVEAICLLASDIGDDEDRRLHAVNHEIGRLLGPNGGIERWGWSLLSVLIFIPPHILNTSASASQLLLESNNEAVQSIPFPEVTLYPLVSRSAQAALERMLRAMGRAAGEDGLFASEWFLDIGKSRRDHRAVAGLWCACRLLEGIGGVPLDSYTLDIPIGQRKRKLEKFVRGVARTLPELWDEDEPAMDETEKPQRPSEQVLLDGHEDVVIEHTKGLITIRSPLDIGRPTPPVIHASPPPAPNPSLHKALALQNLAICAGILQARFTPLLLNVLYPILHSLVSDSTHLSSTALATLHYITHFTSYASPSNLLLSNFDYALDSVSRRLSRRWLDMDAPKVLVVLTRLVGRNVVQKAGDVVEECFDRLDEFHGYEVLVDGLIAVLLEVVVIVGNDEQNHIEPKRADPSTHTCQVDNDRFDSFFEWFGHRHEQPPEDDTPGIQFSEVPKSDWGAKDEDGDQHAGQAEDPAEETAPTPTQSLTKQIVSRSLYFLTHGSPLIRARILNVLVCSVPVLPESALLPSIHQAWPFILNRMSDPEPFVVAAAISLVEVLSNRVGDFMHQRIWNDVWPRFQTLLRNLEATDSMSALARRGAGIIGTESAYTVSHRLYKAMIGTMKAATTGVQARDTKAWEVILAFRRFLHKEAHEELQDQARELYHALTLNNPDAVWFALSATQGEIDAWSFLHNARWSIQENAQKILQAV